MQKFIIWLKINWLKVLLISVLVLILIGIGTYIKYVATSFMQLETFSKRQAAGYHAMTFPMFVFAQLLVLPFFFLISWYFYQGGGIGSTKVNRVDKEGTGVSLDDVIGLDEAKKDALEVVKLLRDHAFQKAVGGNIIKGTLLIGPPGCGKTYLAKAMATECKLPMISTSGSEFVAMFMGQGAARMKSLFKQGRELAKIHGGCIIFIDEIDAFARPRDERTKTGLPAQAGDISHSATINQFLTELDGLRKSENNIVIIAATNVNEDELDAAIMRSGRFDRKIRVEKPNAIERAKIIKYYLSKVSAEASIDVAFFAEKAKWFSPSDIHNMVREAVVIASRQSRSTINRDDLKEALTRIMISLEKMGGDKILTEKVNVKWNDVIGMESAKKEAWEIVELLRDRNKLKAVGGKIVKGVIMLGPPGCGKTYLAKAMATESGFPFISRTGSDFVRMWVGEGARMVEETFKEGRKLARAEGGCIIFIDEIDAFAFPRTTDRGFGATSSMNAAINQFLTELDGLRQAENNIVVFAATNVSENMLDPAVMRPGRFDRKIYITLPNLKEREDLFGFYLSRVKADVSCNPKLLAQKTPYFSPSQIDSMVREAGIFAMREKRDTICFKDLSNAYDRIQYGDKSNILLTEKEKIETAYHEAGHAIIGYLLHPSDDIIKATIIPRKGSLGMVSLQPREETHSKTKEELLANIKFCVAAYVAEKLKFGYTTSGVGGGAGSDFGQAMTAAHAMVWNLGMGKTQLVGDFGALRNYNGDYSVSEKTKEKLDEDVQAILSDCIQEVESILRKHNDLFEHFAKELIKKGELEYEEIKAIFDQFGLQPASRPQIS
ncbi:MAG: AAA family ATPase [Candidatus Omnitrophota bacterium]